MKFVADYENDWDWDKWVKKKLSLRGVEDGIYVSIDSRQSVFVGDFPLILYISGILIDENQLGRHDKFVC
jgi:hypothetical protein